MFVHMDVYWLLSKTFLDAFIHELLYLGHCHNGLNTSLFIICELEPPEILTAGLVRICSRAIKKTVLFF